MQSMESREKRGPGTTLRSEEAAKPAPGEVGDRDTLNWTETLNSTEADGVKPNMGEGVDEG